MAWFTNLLHNTYFVWCAMAVLIFLVTQVIKLPIKHFTKKIKNERTRKIVNSVFLLIPFALGILAEFLYSTYYLHIAFTVITGLGYGTAGISLYGIIERFFKVKVDNPYDTEEGKAATDFIEDVAKDNKIDKDDLSNVSAFLSQMGVCEEIDDETKKSVSELVKEATKDGVFDEKDMTAVKEFLDKVKK